MLSVSSSQARQDKSPAGGPSSHQWFCELKWQVARQVQNELLNQRYCSNKLHPQWRKNSAHLLGQRVAQVSVISARNETLIKAKPDTSMCNSIRRTGNAMPQCLRSSKSKVAVEEIQRIGRNAWAVSRSSIKWSLEVREWRPFRSRDITATTCLCINWLHLFI